MRIYCNEKCEMRPVGTNICSCNPDRRPANCPCNKNKDKDKDKQ